VDFTQSVANDNDVFEFYVGRTTDLLATRRRHGCEAIVPIYESSSTDNAADIEDALIKSFFDHPKCSNTSTHCGGNCSIDYFSYVYLALWFADN
jgi:hypothetical protein